MSEVNTTLAIMMEGWQAYQEELIRAIAPLTPEQLALRAAPGLRSVGELATHIVSARANWFSQALAIGGDEFVALGGWQAQGAPARTADELVTGLRRTWEVMTGAMATWSPDDVAAVVEGVRRGQPFSLKRGWIVWHLIEHDTHHGGEISYSLGMHGLKGLDI